MRSGSSELAFWLGRLVRTQLGEEPEHEASIARSEGGPHRRSRPLRIVAAGDLVRVDRPGDRLVRVPHQPKLRAIPAMAGCTAMDDAVPAERLPEPQKSRRHVLTPRRIVAVIAVALLAFSLRRHLGFARDVFRHRRRLKLALTVLVFLRQLRRT